MRALVLFYNGGEPTTNCKAAIATAIEADTGANIGEMVMKVLNETELTNLTVSAVIPKNNETSVIDEAVYKSVEFLKEELKSGKTDETSVLVRLLMAMRTRSDKDVVENSIRVIGLHQYPNIIRTRCGISTGAINACKTLCNSIL